MAETIITTEYSEEMQRSYMNYSMSVITARAIPDARDGLKPVQRRVLYDMGELQPGESEVKVPTELPTITKGSNVYCTLTFSNAEKWLAQNLTVTVNDVAYDKTGSIYNLDNGGAYYIEENNISLKIPYEMFDTKTSMLVISDGTSTINFTVTMPGSFILGAEPTIAFTK